MKGVIGFEEHRINCIIGILPQERVEPQDIFIDLKVGYDFSISSVTDDILDTIDYTKMTFLCTEIAQEGKYQLLEKLAADILKALLDQFDITWAWIRIKKPNGIPSAQNSSVELELHRDRV